MVVVLTSLLMVCGGLMPEIAFASEGGDYSALLGTWQGYLSVILFVLAYVFVVMEEKIHMRKSKPVLIGAGVIWVLVALAFNSLGRGEELELVVGHNILEYAQLFLFLLPAMTYINALDERNVFQALRSWLVLKGYSLRVIFWVTGVLAFFISPIADNLTTALLMGAVVMAVGGDNKRFVALACINIVVAANAGGAFSPFGDITTLMVWQKGKVEFFEFFDLFIPSVVSWLVPAIAMSIWVGNDKPAVAGEAVRMKLGAKRIMLLFFLTIVTAVSFHNFLHLPSAIGMMFGLGYLGLFAYYLKLKERRIGEEIETLDGIDADALAHSNREGFDVFKKLARAEWDTLMFFYGVIMCVGGLAQFGYLAKTSEMLYLGLGATTANILVGVLSAMVDNIPVMFAVLTMNPSMPHDQWLLVTLTAGIGGSLLSIGSAAGVGLMGTARGVYTFGAHLRWTPIIALGYVLGIYAHILLNAKPF